MDTIITECKKFREAIQRFGKARDAVLSLKTPKEVFELFQELLPEVNQITKTYTLATQPYWPVDGIPLTSATATEVESFLNVFVSLCYSVGYEKFGDLLFHADTVPDVN